MLHYVDLSIKNGSWQEEKKMHYMNLHILLDKKKKKKAIDV